MTAGHLTYGRFPVVAERDKVTPKPPARPALPLLIGDAVTPWRGETLLLALLRAQAGEADDQP